MFKEKFLFEITLQKKQYYCLQNKKIYLQRKKMLCGKEMSTQRLNFPQRGKDFPLSNEGLFPTRGEKCFLRTEKKVYSEK